MEIYWRESAIRSLKQLDKWRESIDLPPIANYLKKTVEIYFRKQDYSFYIPGREVLIRKMPIDLRIVLISVGASDPYKIFLSSGRDWYRNIFDQTPVSKTNITFTNKIKCLIYIF